MKWRIIKISNLILALLLVAFTIGYTYAWFADYYSVDIKLYVSPDGGYFESGDGSETDPYVISSYRHLYNLAWLQNSGKFNQTDDNGNYTQTYFKLKNDINMEISTDNICVIPPIGNYENPFIGIFDGGGYTISNLIVSTDKTKLTNFPIESATGYEFSSYVGLFGKTGTYTDTTSNKTYGADIKNFILNKPILEVATSNTAYSTANENKCFCGLAIGYVAFKASSIGVIGGTLAVKKEGYSTYNSILGAYDEDKITSHITGDIGYGSSADIETLAIALGGDKSGISKDYAYPFRAKNGYDSATQLNTSYGYTVQASSSNIGYYVGSDVKFYNVTDVNYSKLFSVTEITETYSVSDSNFTDMTSCSVATIAYTGISSNGNYYTIDGNISVTLDAYDTISITVETADTLIAKINDKAVSLTNENLTYSYTADEECTVVFSKAADGTTLNVSSISAVGQKDITSSVSSEVAEYLDDYKDSTNKNTGYSGYTIRVSADNADLSKNTTKIAQSMTGGVYSSDLLLPNRSIWVSPIEAGTLKFVVCNSESSDVDFKVLKWTRSADYDAAIPSSYTTYEYNGLKGFRAYYFEIEVTADDVSNGYEYAVMGKDGPYITYIDLGQEGADTSTKNEMSNIDFIYNYDTDSTVVIENDSTSANYGCFVLVSGGALYTETGTMIAFDAVDTTGAIIILAFSRPDGGTDSSSYTIYVSYYVDGYGTPTSSVSGKESLTSYDTYKEENNTYVFSNSE